MYHHFYGPDIPVALRKLRELHDAAELRLGELDESIRQRGIQLQELADEQTAEVEIRKSVTAEVRAYNQAIAALQSGW